MANCECIKCQGELVSPLCVEINSEKYCTLEGFVTSVENSIKELEKPHTIDIKTLSILTDLSRDAIIQILINEIIALKQASPGSSGPVCSNVDWSAVNTCQGCSNDFCTQLQLFINKVSTLT